MAQTNQELVTWAYVQKTYGVTGQNVREDMERAKKGIIDRVGPLEFWPVEEVGYNPAPAVNKATKHKGLTQCQH